MDVVLLSKCDKTKESLGSQGVCMEATVVIDHKIEAEQRGR